MIKQWICPRCGHNWSSEISICEICTEIGMERKSQDILDSDNIFSIDEMIEEIEGKDDDEENWRF